MCVCQEVVYVSAKLRLLEHRQQRISEVRAKYQCLKKELEQTKQHLMLEPHKWTTECKYECVCVCVCERQRESDCFGVTVGCMFVCVSYQVICTKGFQQVRIIFMRRLIGIKEFISMIRYQVYLYVFFLLTIVSMYSNSIFQLSVCVLQPISP